MSNQLDVVKQGFDRIQVKHLRSATYQATHVGLVKGDKVFVGIAKCHKTDQFNKKMGIKIALGRAIHAWKVDAGITRPRSKTKHTAVFKGLNKEGIEGVLEAIDHEPVLASADVNTCSGACGSTGGCCGRGCN